MSPAPTRAGSVAMLLAAAWLLLPAPVLSQGQQCVFQIDNVDRQGAVVETPQGTNYFAGGNVRLSCRGTKISMESDSVAAYGGNVVRFIGRVKYRDSTLTMDADRGTYIKSRERWEARGRVVTKNLGTGSTLTGPSLDYLRVVKGVRDLALMEATPNRALDHGQGVGQVRLGQLPIATVLDLHDQHWPDRSLLLILAVRTPGHRHLVPAAGGLFQQAHLGGRG